MQKRLIPAVVIVAMGIVGLQSMKAHAADGTITINGAVSDTTCSINGVAAGSPADVLLNGRLIAHGEIVVIDQDYAVRITKILDTAEDLD